MPRAKEISLSMVLLTLASRKKAMPSLRKLAARKYTRPYSWTDRPQKQEPSSTFADTSCRKQFLIEPRFGHFADGKQATREPGGAAAYWFRRFCGGEFMLSKAGGEVMYCGGGVEVNWVYVERGMWSKVGGK